MRDKSHAYLDLRMFVFRYAHVGRTDHSHVGQIDCNRNPGSPGRGLWRRRHATFYLSLHQLPFGLAISMKGTSHADDQNEDPTEARHAKPYAGFGLFQGLSRSRIFVAHLIHDYPFSLLGAILTVNVVPSTLVLAAPPVGAR